MELLDLESSFEELKSLNIVDYFVLPINADLSKFETKLKKLLPGWIKLNSWEHKTELGGVKRVNNLEELKKVHNELKKKFPGKKFIVQKNVEGTEIMAGIKQDKTFGKVLLIGAGGSLAELIKDTEFRILPLEKEEIEQAIRQLKVFKLLEEKQANTAKLVDLIKKFSDMKIAEADLNPIIVNEKDAFIVDARIRILDE